MSSPNCANGSSSSRSPAYLTGDGVDNHVIEVRSKLHPFAQKNLGENVLHLFENPLVLGLHWFGHIPKEIAILFRDDAKAPLCYQSSTSLASHTWVSKNLSRSFPSSEVRNSAIDRLLPRHRSHWKRAGIFDAILLSKQSINRDENLLAAALRFWNSASNTFNFRLGPMTPTLLDMAQIFGFRPMEGLWTRLAITIGGRIKKSWPSHSPSIRIAPQREIEISNTCYPSMTNNLGGQAIQSREVIVENSPPPSKAKRLRKRAVSESERAEEPAAVPTETTETDQELRETFEAEEIPAEVIAESIELAKKQQEVEEDRTAGILAVVTSPFKPPIVAMPIHSIPGSSTTASFVDPELAGFEAMDMDAQLDKLEKLSSTPGKAKSNAMDEAMDRVKIWQSTELDLDENKEAVN
ncbi:unnamed protein product [Prunus brigantina]